MPEPVRVGLLVDSDAFGGAEVYVRQLLRRLPAHFRRRLVVAEPVAPHFRDLHALCEDVTVVPLLRGRDPGHATASLLAGHAVDVWHVNLVDPGSNRAALAAASALAPTVATLHMPGHAHDATVALRALYGGLTTVIAVSREIAETVRERFGVPGDRVVRVRNGVDVPPRAAPPVRASGGTPCRIGAVGRLTEQKGFDVLVGAVARLVAEGHPITVEVAGDGRDRAALERAAAGLPVRFHGFVADVPAFLRGLDVFCLPSRREALSLALLEAMAHALPCVTTPVGDVTEVLGDTVVTVPVDDPAALARALGGLVADPERARRLGLRARRLAVGGLDAAGMVAATADVLAAAAASAQPSSARAAATTVPGASA
ncbi:glycosyltransferase family 4 protein [Streptomyces coeruleoprunus]|uniref:D-inositol 3-phosphate glycosyltransferase n=1 Tax=Streptomyces coeruleoprunus TaxID=285563 RepID=A0ABV9XA12_9ACTN